MNKQDLETVKSVVRNIPDFPVPGIQFKDLTTAFKDPKALAIMTEALTDLYRDAGITKVVGIEARGFIGGAILATQLGAGFVPLRKPGKLPAEVIQKSYTKEYGTDTIEIHQDAITAADRPGRGTRSDDCGTYPEEKSIIVQGRHGNMESCLPLRVYQKREEFQAPEFYKKLGYDIEFIRQTEDPKLNKYFFRKDL